MTSNGENGKTSNVEPLRPPRPCPECGRTSSRADYPFCSPRCRDVDLNRWLSGSYAIPVSEEEENTGPEQGSEA